MERALKYLKYVWAVSAVVAVVMGAACAALEDHFGAVSLLAIGLYHGRLAVLAEEK